MDRVVGLYGHRAVGFTVRVAFMGSHQATERNIHFAPGDDLERVERDLTAQGIETSYLDPHFTAIIEARVKAFKERARKEKELGTKMKPKFSLRSWPIRPDRV